MRFSVETSDHSYEFSGPYTSAENLKKKSGVYLISTKKKSGNHKIIDIGESGNMRERVSHHDRAQEWQPHQKNGLYFSAYYCQKARRKTIQTELRLYFDPPCGDR